MVVATRIPAGRMLMEMQKAGSNLTGEQTLIVEAAIEALEGKGNPAPTLKVIAFAGTGKTTSLVAVSKALHALPGPRRRGLYLAFNRQIANESQTRFKPFGCRALTMHSLAWKAVGVDAPEKLDAKAVAQLGIADRLGITRMDSWGPFRVNSAIARTVRAFCASADRKIDVQHARTAILEVEPDPCLINDDDEAMAARAMIERRAETIADAARLVFDACVKGDLGLDHDVYLKFLDLSSTLRNKAFDGLSYLMIDECQDLNPVQRSIATKSGLPLIAVGDPYQQIYGWRGAENALAALPDDFRTLYLTQSFRFTEGIASTARAILAGRPDGGPAQRLIGSGNGEESAHGVKSAILCRTNIGVIGEGLGALASGLKVNLAVDLDELARDVQSANALRLGRRKDVISPDISAFPDWQSLLEAADAGDRGLAIIAGFVERQETGALSALKASVVPESAADVVISTAHKAKGREWDSVALGADWASQMQRKKRYQLAERRGGRHPGMAMEEWNALYVAATRAMVNLNIEPELVALPEEIRQAPSSVLTGKLTV